jgi:hypothetical protein
MIQKTMIKAKKTKQLPAKKVAAPSNKWQF